jgi:hypothetical protein
MTDTSLINRRAEDLVVQMVLDGVFHIDDRGRVWGKHGRVDTHRVNGYLAVRVMVDGVRLRVRAHRLVYRCQVGPIPDGMVVDHINQIRDDNEPSNLEAVTHAENMRRMFARRRLARLRNAMDASITPWAEVLL